MYTSKYIIYIYLHIDTNRNLPTGASDEQEGLCLFW